MGGLTGPQGQGVLKLFLYLPYLLGYVSWSVVAQLHAGL